MSDLAGQLTLHEIEPVRKRVYQYPWERHPDFVARWMLDRVLLTSTQRFIVIRRDGTDVVRCTFTLRDELGEVELDILGFEVNVRMRRQGIGRAALHLIRDTYPGPRMTVLNENAQSAAFWEGIGWKLRPDGEMYGALRGDPRVSGTYVAPDPYV